LIKLKPGFSGKMFWSLEIPFKTGFTIYIYDHEHALVAESEWSTLVILKAQWIGSCVSSTRLSAIKPISFRFVPM